LADQFIYIYYPLESYNQDIVNVEKGYDGSSKDNVLDLELLHQEHVCTCLPCLKDDFQICVLPEVFGSIKWARIKENAASNAVVTRGDRVTVA
jgi:hypothetical protein